MKKTILLSLLLITLFASSSCKKKHTTDDVKLKSTTESITINSDFGDNGSLLLFNTEYSDFKISNNKIVLREGYGDPLNSSNDHTTLCKIDTNGTFDATFGMAGVSSYNFFMSGFNFLPNNELLVYGDYNYKLGVDASTIPVLFNYTHCYNVVELNNGKFLVAKADTLFRINSDYTMDPSFIFTTGFNTNKLIEKNNAYYVFDKANKKIIKILQNGGIDGSFATNGAITISDRNQEVEISIFNENLYLYYSTPMSNGYSIKIMKYDLNGILDNSFGSSGSVIIIPPQNEDYFIESLLVSNSGNIYLYASDIGTSTVSKIFLMKLSNNGVVDTTFGVNGFYSIQGILYTYDAEIYNGNIYLLGESKSYPNSSLISKYKIQ